MDIGGDLQVFHKEKSRPTFTCEPPWDYVLTMRRLLFFCATNEVFQRQEIWCISDGQVPANISNLSGFIFPGRVMGTQVARNITEDKTPPNNSSPQYLNVRSLF